MECLSRKAELENVVSDVRAFSYSEKKSPIFDEKRLNYFLDAILEVKQFLSDKTERINKLNDDLEKLTWHDDLDEDCLMLINDLIATARDLHSSLIRQYVQMNFIRSKGIAKNEIIEFKTSVDELKEICSDLESTFFFLPKIPGFLETTKSLSLI